MVLLTLQAQEEWEVRHGGLMGLKYLMAVRQVGTVQWYDCLYYSLNPFHACPLLAVFQLEEGSHYLRSKPQKGWLSGPTN